MSRLTKKLLNRKTIVIIISLLLLAFGIYSYYVMPKQEMPEIKMPVGIIEIIAPGYNADEIKEYISTDVEDIVNKYSSLDYYTVTCLDNAMIMIIEMNIDNTDYIQQFKDIENELLDTKLDDRITEITMTAQTSAPEVIYAIYSSSLSELELENNAKALAKELNNVTHISNTIVDSPYDKEVLIKIDYEELNKLAMTTKDVYSIIYASGIQVPLGNIEINSKDSSIILDAKYENLEDINDLIIYIDSTTGTVIQIKDIATVSLKDTDDKRIYEYNGKTAVFVEMYFDENIDYTKIDEEIKSTVEDFINTNTGDYEITSVIYSPEHVKTQVNQVMINLLQCIGIVMLVVLIGLGVRNSIVIAFTIPVIVMSTIGLLYVLNNDLQLMSIAGLIISIGILVDNSIVISDSVQHNLDIGMEKDAACVAAVKENWLPVLTSTLTTIAAFAPLLSLKGTAGDVTFTLPLTLLISISLSFIAAITLTPVLASWLFKPHKKRLNKKTHDYKVLTSAIRFTLKLKILPTLLAIVSLAAMVYAVISTQEIDLFPKTEKTIVYMDYEYNVLNDNEGSYEFAKRIEEVVLSQEDLLQYGFSQGGDLPQFDTILVPVTNLPQYGRFILEYDCSANELDSYIEKLNEDISHLREFGDIAINRLELSAPIAPVQLILVSSDFDLLKDSAADIYSQIEELDSFSNGELKLANMKSDIVLDVDKNSLAMHSLTIAELQEQITIAVNGITEELFTQDNNSIPTKIITNIDSPYDLMNMNIVNSNNESVRLGDIVSYDNIENLEYTTYYNGLPCVTIDAYMASGYSTYDLEKDIKDIVVNSTETNISAIYKGDNATTNDVIGGLLIALIIALIIIYFIMYFQFSSFIQPMIIFISIPLSFIGSLAAMLIMNEKITLTGLLGLVSLVGIVVNNGILLVENINNLRKDGKSVYDSCILAANRRLRPILLSSLTTILGLIPLAVFGGDFFRPMAVILMGGLVVSTMLIIFMVPNLYYLFYKKKDIA